MLDNTIISLVSTPINNEESNVAPRTPRTRGRRNPVKSPINNNVNQQILEESAINNAKAPSSTNRRGWAAPADADEQNIQENVATTTHQTSWLSNVLNTPRRRAATPPPADAIDNTAASSSSPSVNGDTLHELSSSLASEGLLGRALSSAKKLLTPKPPSRQQMVAQLNEVEEDENERGLITEDFEVYEQQIVEEEDAAEDGVAAVGGTGWEGAD